MPGLPQSRRHRSGARGRLGHGHPIFAAIYERLNLRGEEGWLGGQREQLIARAHGEVLEIGAGAGANLPHYPTDGTVHRVVCSEPDPAMRRRLTRRLGALERRDHPSFEVVDADAEHLPFDDATFDIVVSTLVLCSVDDLGRALDEIRRVLRPGGRLLFLEHVRGPRRAARWQNMVTPIWRRLCAGCHPNRETLAAIASRGFVVAQSHTFDPPGTPFIVCPFIEGSAVR